VKSDAATLILSLQLDEQLEQRLSALQDRVRSAATNKGERHPHRPHITLAAYQVAAARSLDRLLAHFCSQRRPIPIEIRALGIFPEAGVVFAAPLVTSALLRLRQQLQRCIARTTPYPDHLSTGRWIPHISLGNQLQAADLGRALKVITSDWSTLEGLAVGIGVIRPPSVVDRAAFVFAGGRRKSG
jgi:2'-5' RNA ligase